MAKLKDRKLYKKGILKLKLGGEVPASPFTMKGINQAGISALNTIKNPTAMARGLATRSLGVMGLTNPYTAPLVAPMVMYSIADAMTPQSVKDRAQLKRLVEGEYPGIMDYDQIPENRSTVDLLKEANQLNVNSPLTQRLNLQFEDQVKTDDRETGAETIERVGSNLTPKIEKEIENKPPEKNRNDAQVLVEDQKKLIKNSEKVFNDLESEARKQGKMTRLSEAMDAARDVMGERGYNKSGRLLLLQLAANLLSGKTDQQGVRGFLDVLGQAGKNVIPMALALEREREQDELTLAKLLLDNDKKQGKIKPPSMKIRYRKADGEISDPVPASVTDDGSYLVYDTLGDKSIRYFVDPGQVVGQVDIKDNVANKAKLLAEYKAVKSGDLYTSMFIDVAAKNPDLIGVRGGYKKIFLKGFELFKSATNSNSYRETVLKLADNEKQSLENFKRNGGQVDEAAESKLNKLFDKINDTSKDLDSATEEIQAQAMIETLELLSTYALAQTLKDKDRLAVADIERAEKRLGNTIGYLPFIDNNPMEIITAYQKVNEKFKNRIGGIRNTWKDIYYYNPMELDAIDKDYASQLVSESQKNINKFVEGFDQQNNQDQEMFEKMFNQNNLQGIIKK